MELTPPAKRKRPFPWLLASIVGGILAIAGTSVAVINATRPKTDFESLTIPATEEALTARIPASGTVVPIQSVNVSPPKAGRLVQLRVEQGDRVEQNQLIAIMENDDIQAKGMQANANLQQAIANLNAAKVRIPGEIDQAKARFASAQANYAQAIASYEEARRRLPAETNQVQQQVNSARVSMALAEAKAKRNQFLYQEGAITRDRLDEVLADFYKAQAAFNEAQQRLQESQSTDAPALQQRISAITQLKAAAAEARIAAEQRERSAREEIKQLEAAAGAAQAQLQQVKIEYDQTGIRAPFAGIVTQKYANPGSFVTPTTSASGAASATSTSIIALARGLEIVAKVPEVDVGQLRPGQPVEIAADAYPDKIFRGLIKQVAPEAVIEQNVTSFEVRVAIDDKAEKELRSGMNVDLTFIGERLSNAVVVPTVAIVTDEGKRGVMVIGEDNKPKFREAKIGLTLGDKTQILEGLKPGERVFTDLPEDSQPKNDE
ncbi:efflux RND transporter periplasmic adaptor subunit [Oscillatoria sp. FACHB-1406]|uniref:efflux RND transporter periplasmic adaptor subunit n=1 Tax=Oscillatoria sp. FACHB-1406 TaxID=2692846 RepID=UPI0016863280|nr:efflux RND transporter periplasmic adaptor subunit [Oscillatoria sp. FACHB-1406]MBD2578851.1 efflux RND transporter periplasmic adaptor subunit [Oscillatoria sp. FACHB-1406]